MLTDATIRKQCKPGPQAYKMTDRDGLYLLVQPSGGRCWRYDYRYAGKRKTLALGVYPDVPLVTARERLLEARQQVADNLDPSAVRKAAKTEQQRLVNLERDTFETVATEWLGKHKAKLAPKTVIKNNWLFKTYLFPEIGHLPIAKIEPPILLATLQKIEALGHIETTHRTKQIAGQVFRFAIATGRAQRDPSADLRGALTPVTPTHHAAVIEPEAIGSLLRAISGFSGSFPVRQALRLAPLLFVRPGELRAAEWSEIDFDANLWRIPAWRTKLRRQHLVPLATQAVALLRELQPLTGHGRYVFPSIRTDKRPMSDNTLNAGLRRLGYGHDEMTAHGFRTMASTRLNEMGYRSDVIEKQLAHEDKDTVRAAYNRAEHLDERQQMMIAWADELDRLREGREA
ncbi:MAG: tyrosine-type recombinase/integrase [Acidobacteria bacterium]|nr:tyrosine-type recombinase/integrase [Acidobacteriota bacterium]